MAIDIIHGARGLHEECAMKFFQNIGWDPRVTIRDGERQPPRPAAACHKIGVNFTVEKGLVTHVERS